jgi:hypothetical protein
MLVEARRMASLKPPATGLKPPKITQTFSPSPVKINTQSATYTLKLTHAGGGEITITQVEIGLILTTGAIFYPVSCTTLPKSGAYDPVNPGEPIIWTGSVKLSSKNPTFTLTLQGPFNGTTTSPVQSGTNGVKVINSGSSTPTTAPKQEVTVQPS